MPRDILPELTQLEDGLAHALNLLTEQRTFRRTIEERVGSRTLWGRTR